MILLVSVCYIGKTYASMGKVVGLCINMPNLQKEMSVCRSNNWSNLYPISKSSNSERHLKSLRIGLVVPELWSKKWCF